MRRNDDESHEIPKVETYKHRRVVDPYKHSSANFERMFGPRHGAGCLYGSTSGKHQGPVSQNWRGGGDLACGPRGVPVQTFSVFFVSAVQTSVNRGPVQIFGGLRRAGCLYGPDVCTGPPCGTEWMFGKSILRMFVRVGRASPPPKRPTRPNISRPPFFGGGATPGARSGGGAHFLSFPAENRDG